MTTKRRHKPDGSARSLLALVASRAATGSQPSNPKPSSEHIGVKRKVWWETSREKKAQPVRGQMRAQRRAGHAEMDA